MAETAVPTIGEIIGNLGGSMAATTIVPALEELKDLLGEGGVSEAVSDWLDAHPEATTTVEDGSITKAKLASSMYDEISAADVAAMF